MKIQHRVENGRKAAGVPKNFSLDELDRRRERMAFAQRARMKKIHERREAMAKQKTHIEACASVGVFVPVDSALE
jgi:hypothetical protein